MNKYNNRIIDFGLKSEARLVLPELQDKRVISARKELLSMGFNIVDHEQYMEKYNYYLEYIEQLSFTKNWPKKNLKSFLNNPLNFSMVMLSCNDADGLVAGACTATSTVIRTAIRIIGVKSTSNWVSSIFLLISPDGEKAFTFADCAVIPEPTSQQLAFIGADSSKFHYLLTGNKPLVAFLSFSTKGSAEHYRVKRVSDAVTIFQKKFPNITSDGEIQIDAAIIPEINKIKSPDSPLNGMANVLIFPNLDSGNIAYKIAHRMGNYFAWGPLLQGLNKPVHDLSRGCSINDIINVAAITAMQKQEYANI